MSRPNKQTETLLLEDSIGLKDLTDIYKVVQPNTANADSSGAHETFSNVGHILEHQPQHTWEDGNDFLELESWGTFDTKVEGNRGAEEGGEEVEAQRA